jgi:hypothetical protein
MSSASPTDFTGNRLTSLPLSLRHSGLLWATLLNIQSNSDLSGRLFAELKREPFPSLLPLNRSLAKITPSLSTCCGGLRKFSIFEGD